jgi:hypothetical protein
MKILSIFPVVLSNSSWIVGTKVDDKLFFAGKNRDARRVFFSQIRTKH